MASRQLHGMVKKKGVATPDDYLGLLVYRTTPIHNIDLTTPRGGIIGR